MGFGEAIRNLGRVAWPGESGLNNAKPRLKDRSPGSYNPLEAKTPREALTYIELLYKSGRMEDLAKLLRRSQVFRAAWLMLQQSSPEVFKSTAGVKGSAHRGKTQDPIYLPAPATGPPSLFSNLELGTPGPEAGKTEFFPQVPAAGNCSFETEAFQDARPLTSRLQVYQSQDRYCVQEKQHGQRINIRA